MRVMNRLHSWRRDVCTGSVIHDSDDPFAFKFTLARLFGIAVVLVTLLVGSNREESLNNQFLKNTCGIRLLLFNLLADFFESQSRLTVVLNQPQTIIQLAL